MQAREGRISGRCRGRDLGSSCAEFRVCRESLRDPFNEKRRDPDIVTRFAAPDRRPVDEIEATCGKLVITLLDGVTRLPGFTASHDRRISSFPPAPEIPT
jgi:hypothetical protein